jgi:hypothetical protein
MRRSIIAVLTIVAFLLPSFGTTVAAQGNAGEEGAFNHEECDVSGEITSCWESVGEFHSVATPSGNYMSIVNVPWACLTQTITATGAVVYHQCYTFQEIYISKRGEGQVEHARDIAEFTEDGVTYCYGYRFQEANGQLQYVKWVGGMDEEC